MVAQFQAGPGEWMTGQTWSHLLVAVDGPEDLNNGPLAIV
jgi:hypothetical protein